MPDRQAAALTLARHETQRLHVAAATTVWVVSGRVLVRGPLQWLAETLLAPEQCLGPEQRLDLAAGGWIDLVGLSDARVAVLSRDRTMPWRWLARILDDWADRMRRKQLPSATGRQSRT
jgi:hypothetical protein